MKKALIDESRELDEERAYWEKRSSLAPGNRARYHKAVREDLRNSFLAVRLTGAEIDQLREKANSRGLNLSAFVRSVLIGSLQSGNQPVNPIGFEELSKRIEAMLPPPVMDSINQLAKEITLADSMVLMDSNQTKAFVRLSALLTQIMFAAAGTPVVMPFNHVAKTDNLVKATA